MWGETNWGGGAGRKAPPVKRQAGGMAEALCIASDLGFSIPTPQVFSYFKIYPLFSPLCEAYTQIHWIFLSSVSFVDSNLFGSVLGSEIFYRTDCNSQF